MSENKESTIIPDIPTSLPPVFNQPEPKSKKILLKQIFIVIISLLFSAFISFYIELVGFPIYQPGILQNILYMFITAETLVVIVLFARVHFSYEKLRVYYLAISISVFMALVPFIFDFLFSVTHSPFYENIVGIFYIILCFNPICPAFSITHTYFHIWIFHFLYWALFPLPLVFFLEKLRHKYT